MTGPLAVKGSNQIPRAMFRSLPCKEVIDTFVAQGYQITNPVLITQIVHCIQNHFNQ